MSCIDNAKQAMGFKQPNQRAGCGNCKHVQEEHPGPGFNVSSLRCGKGAFYVKRFAICDDWADAVGVRG